MTGLIVEHRGAVCLLTIDREDARNALDAATSRAMDEAISAAEADPAVGAIIVTGTGNRAFCAGMDLKEAERIGAGHGLIPGRGFGGITERRRTKPLIAAINGTAVAGGFEIMMACDMVFAADHALMGVSEVKRGLFAFAGGIQRLAAQVPRATALAMIMTGELLPARRLYDLGVVTEVVPGDRLLDRALEVTQAMLANSWQAIGNGRELYELSTGMDTAQALAVGNAWGKATLASADSREGIAAYAQKRDAQFGQR
ncbi:enoyl-CoA hydratase-related protein [Novosphingobium resinovorum]|jgi:enoyl-CoA hydratase/carnithine racemase|uniref:enoyl-CoA hydratase/isomerase family protein n=1 Tax=Novosphingobium TaxID=165696 RepID=UPI001B3C90C6|nr:MULTISPECIES: enoyl-CoA hydratase-related protein [Novosphingobium]MBF7014928.1 enoyl-CoA hydratase/isomerase family protein [Novosphingobium sp. HR1a]WJM24595.1 enoyl-CoA hydratase-related protein [Novosphingobium resinovorum]